MDLTDEQRAILQTRENLLVIAGPGTGKTFTLIRKVKHLLENSDLSSDKILVLTYSLKTCKELKSKFNKEGLSEVKVDTFHGYAYDLWKRVYDTEPPLITEIEKKRILSKLFGKVKNPLINQQSKKLYFEYLRKNKLLDFELLLIEVAQFKNFEFRDYVIIIDEFQDLSEDILTFLELFKEASFVLFGDPNQSIYRFRGCDIQKTFSFLNRFLSNLKILSLSKSFRCPEEILKYAERFKTSPWKTPSFQTEKKGGIFQGFLSQNTSQEIEFLIDFVKSLLGGLQLEHQKPSHFSPKDVLILSRIKEVFYPLKEAFIKAGIPVNFVEKESEENFKIIQDFIERLKTDHFSPEILIQQIKPSLKPFLQNFWDLSFHDKGKFISYLLTLNPLEIIDTEKEGINFMSIHASKGLEAEVVILLGCEEGLIPLTLFKDFDLEEEKRLVYVALTRTKQRFYFSATRERKIFNYVLREISSYFKEFPIKILKPKTKTPKQSSLF